MQSARVVICAALMGSALALWSSSAHAGLADKLEKLVGYTIVASKTIEGWRDGRKRGDGFEGCEYDRVIIFTDGTGLTCREYGYQYAYGATAVILGKSFNYQGRTFYDFKMVVEDEVYDMSQ